MRFLFLFLLVAALARASKASKRGDGVVSPTQIEESAEKDGRTPTHTLRHLARTCRNPNRCSGSKPCCDGYDCDFSQGNCEPFDPCNVAAFVDVPARIEAEDYCNMWGIQTQQTEDVGGGNNVGWIDNGDWMGYPIRVPTAGTFRVTYRVASLTGDGSFDLEWYGGLGVIESISTLPNTGDWQSWAEVSHDVYLPQGEYRIAVKATAAGWNLNWLEISALESTDEPTSSPTISAAPSPTKTYGYLQAKDKDIVISAESNPQLILLRGMGFGGWMVQEPYMMLVSNSAPRGQHSIFEDVEELVGPSGLQQYHNKWLDEYCTEADVKELKRSGFNSLRVALHYNLFTLPVEEELAFGQDTWIQSGFDRLDALLDWCKSHEIYLILDLHAAPGGQGRDSNINDYDPDKSSLWEDQENVRKTVALWERFAERYRDETWVGGYDLINEPNWGFDGINPNGCSDIINSPLKAFYDQAIPTIRAVDQNHIIFIEGNCWGNNHNGLWPIDDSNIVLSFHRYWIQNTMDSIQQYLDLRDEYNVPLWVGETGENSDAWYEEAVQFLESNNIGWAWWTWKKMSSASGSYSIEPPVGYDVLRDYWENGGTKPDASYALGVMLDAAEAARLENCARNYGAVDALTAHVRCEPGVRVPVDLPGRIEAEAYCNMFGAQVEATQDTGGGANVGWIDSGDWLAYPIRVPATGTYSVTYRVASYSGDGSLELEWYGGLGVIGSIENMPNTGGWQNWNNTIHDVDLPEGEHTIAINATVAGWNLNWLEISGPQ